MKNHSHDVKPRLAGHEIETNAKLSRKSPEVSQQTLLQFSLMSILSKHEELERVQISRHLLG